MAQHTSVLPKDIQQFAHDWRDGIDLSDTNRQFREWIMNWLSESKLLFSDHLG